MDGSRHPLAPPHEFHWKRFSNFDEFLDELERYANEYFTQGIILVNEVNVREYDGGDTKLFVIDTASTDVWLKIYVPDRVVMDSYISVPKDDIRLFDEWNGLILTPEQYERLERIFEIIVDHYRDNRALFRAARCEALTNLIIATDGEIIDVLNEVVEEWKKVNET